MAKRTYRHVVQAGDGGVFPLGLPENSEHATVLVRCPDGAGIVSVNLGTAADGMNVRDGGVGGVAVFDLPFSATAPYALGSSAFGLVNGFPEQNGPAAVRYARPVAVHFAQAGGSGQDTEPPVGTEIEAWVG